MSQVVVVKYSPNGPSGRFSQSQYRLLLEIGLCALSGTDDAREAVREFIPPGVVGMKTNCLTRKMNPTPVALTAALSDLLEDAGFSSNDLVIWERTNRELSEAGYSLNASSRGVRCFGTDTNSVGYSRDFHSYGEVNSLVSRILTELIEHNINLPILKDHSLAGLSGGLKNMYGAINNPNKYHENNCSPFCAHVSNLPPIREKNRLTIIDAVRVQYNGGPGYLGQYLADYNGLVISTDTVAVDRVGLEILERIRHAHGQPSLEKAERPAKYLAVAEQIGLGTAHLSRINVKTISVDAAGHQTPGEL